MQVLSIFRAHVRKRSRDFHTLLRLSFYPILALIAPVLVSPTAARADLTPVRVRIAGREFSGKTPAVRDGREVYVPLEFLSAVGVTGRVSSGGETLTVTLPDSADTSELPVRKAAGRILVPLSPLAQALRACIVWPEAAAKEQNGKMFGPPVSLASNGETLLFLARILAAEVRDGTLQIRTSFPVPFQAHLLREHGSARGYVDCYGACVTEGYQPGPVPAGESSVLRLRAGQNTPETARIVLDLASSAALRPVSAPANTLCRIDVALQSIPPSIEKKMDKKMDKKIEKSAPERSRASGLPEVVRRPGRAGAAARGAVASRRGSLRRDAVPIEIRGWTFVAESDGRARLEIATSEPAEAFVRFGEGGARLLIDLPDCVLRLTDPGQATQSLSHPLVSAVRSDLLQTTPPVTRLTLDMTRVVGFSVTPQKESISVELRVPRNATGALADKLIVIDPGHGGHSAGAIGHGGGYTVYEKEITLAIGLKLRSVLEACGARVVMTRDRDTAVGLYDRPNLANSINADLFVSIHNDSNRLANSASGTSTYYHMSDPSSRALATCVQQAVAAVTGLPSRGALSDGILYASGLAVLRASRMPAVLCEVAYINNARDRRKLMDEEFHLQVARAICDGLRAYVEGSSTPIAGSAAGEDSPTPRGQKAEEKEDPE